MLSNAVCVENQYFNSAELLHYLKSEKIRQISNNKFVTLNFVNQLDDKDDEMVLQSFMQTNSRPMLMDISQYFQKKQFGGKVVSLSLKANSS